MNSIDINHLIDTISFSTKFLAVIILFGSLAKIGLTQYFLLKITQAKKSEIKFCSKTGDKVASYTNYEDNAEKVINIYKNIDNDFDDKAS